MAKIIELEVSLRKECGSAVSRRNRRNGYVPGAIYVKGQQSVPILLSKKSVQKSVHGQHLFLLKEQGGQQWYALIEEVQKNPITDNFDHVAFKYVDIHQEVQTHVSLITKGTPVGVSQGGIIEVLLHEIEICCIPTQLPEHITVDISKLEIGKYIAVKDLVLPEGIKVAPSMNPDQVVVIVTAPRMKEEAAAQPVGTEATTAASSAQPATSSGAPKAKGAPASGDTQATATPASGKK